MEVKVYNVKGKMLIAGNWRKFSLELTGIRKEHVIERIYSVLGSRHKLKRFHIKIESIEEIKPEEAKDRFINEILKSDKLVVVSG